MKKKLNKSKKSLLSLFDDFDEGDHVSLLSELEGYEFIGAEFKSIDKYTSDLYKVGWYSGSEKIQSSSSNMINLRYDNQVAAEFAKDHAADLIVGLNDTTRELIRSTIESSVKNELPWQDIKSQLVDNYGFSEARAETIARSESAIVYNQGFVQVAQESGMVDSVTVSDGDGCPECSVYNGQVWSLDEAMANPISHPNCLREFEYNLKDE